MYREIFDIDPSTNNVSESWISPIKLDTNKIKNPLHNTRSSQTFKEVNARVISTSLPPTKITEKFILVASFVV